MKTELKDFAGVSQAREERDRYKRERDELLFKLAEILDEEASEDADQS